MTDDILRAQLLAVRASAQALIATVDVALVATRPEPEPAAAVTPGECPHPDDRVEQIARMGGQPSVGFCLDCGKEID